MKSSQLITDELLGKGTVSLLVLTGLAFSAIGFFVLDESAQNIFAESEVTSIPSSICENGLCYTEGTEEDYNNILVQQGEYYTKTSQISQNEDFSNINFVKNMPIKQLKQSGNKVSLFAEKDSFIREGIQNSNEGSNQALRVMGSGPTNNRALIAFDQEQITDVTAGKILESATLKLYVESNNRNWGDGQLVSIHSLVSNWEEGNEQSAPLVNLLNTGEGVTWDCPVGSDCSSNWNGGIFNQVPTDSIWISNQVAGYWVKFDVTHDILAYQSAEENFGWIIMKSDEESDGQINIASREATANIPELVLVFSDD